MKMRVEPDRLLGVRLLGHRVLLVLPDATLAFMGAGEKVI